MAITAEMLLKSKKIIKEKTGEKTAEFKIKSLEESLGDGTVKIKSLDRATMSRISTEARGDILLNSILLVYNGVVEPNLKSKDLQKGYEVDAHEIVEEIFNWDEIRYVGKRISTISGFGDKPENEVIEEIKNV